MEAVAEATLLGPTVKVCKLGTKDCIKIPKPLLFTQPGCVWCTRTKMLLAAEGVKDYKEVSVTSRRQLNKLREISGQSGAPVIRIGNKVIVGFNETEIRKAIRGGGK
mgnify:CR=1 FL=1